MSNYNTETNDRIFKMIGSGSAVMHVVVFTILGELALENITYGAIVGLFAGVGAYLFLPWFMRLSAIQDESSDDLPFTEAVQRAGGNAQMSVLGLGLELGGIAMFGVGLSRTEAEPVIGLIVAIAVALAVSLVASVLLNRASGAARTVDS